MTDAPALGHHLLMELWDCGPQIDDPDTARAAIEACVAAIGGTLIELRVHHFTPHGVTGVAILAESHLALHSWPERQYLAADLFTCGELKDTSSVIELLSEFFEPRQVDARHIARGVDRR